MFGNGEVILYFNLLNILLIYAGIKVNYALGANKVAERCL